MVDVCPTAQTGPIVGYKSRDPNRDLNWFGFGFAESETIIIATDTGKEIGKVRANAGASVEVEFLDTGEVWTLRAIDIWLGAQALRGE